MKGLCSVAAALALALVVPSLALAQAPPPVDTFTYTKNLHPLGFSPFANTPNLPGLTFTANSDLAFRGKLAFQGHYLGFRIVDISDPEAPRQISFTRCAGNQGDVVVYGDILIRSWNSPAAVGNETALAGPNACDGEPVPVGFEGIHVFDISNLEDPELVGEVELSARPMASRALENGNLGCGSHTDTVAPDLANNRLLIYNATSGGNTALPAGLQDCDWLDILEVPLANPGAARWLHREPLEGGHAAHDNGVILGDANLLAVASGHMSNVFDIGANAFPGGSKADPVPLFTIEEPGVCNTGGPLCNGNWHSAAFSPDGKVIILGWEPGGGAAPECEASDPAVKKSWFFYDATNDGATNDGAKLGQFVLPRPQTAAENCTIHNYNVVPTDKRYLLVGGNYQAGISVVDFTNPAAAKEIAFADPAPLVPTQLGGDWSTYWYNGRIYESDITRGLLIWNLSGKWEAGAKRLPYLNPQTMEFTLDSP